MKRHETQLKPTSNRRYAYTKVVDHRKQPIRGLWRHDGSLYARLPIEDKTGRRIVK